MRKAILTACATVTLGLGAMAQAALPPKYQRQRELEEVLKASVQALEESIDQITWVGEDRYRVLAGKCVAVARIVTVPSAPMIAGPRNFRVKLGRPSCR